MNAPNEIGANGSAKVHSGSSSNSIPSQLANDRSFSDIQELGPSEIGVFYLATNKQLDRREVLNVIDRQISDDPASRERLLREVQSASKLFHPNIVPIFFARPLGDLWVIEMAVSYGESLDEVVKAKGAFTIQDACSCIHQAVMGLRQAHEEGVVHRHIKPSQLLMSSIRDAMPIVQILGFGQARIPLVTNSGSPGPSRFAVESPDYLAPEQILEPANVDIRSDIYSLGCTFYFLLTGKPPFQGGSGYEILQHHVMTEAPRLDLIRTDVPRELASLIAKMMAKNRNARFQSPDEVAFALAPFVTRSAPPNASLPSSRLEISVRESAIDGPGGNPPAMPSAPVANTNSRPRLDEVQFTVYRPKVVRPAHWYPMLAFTHLAERRPDALPSEPDPIEQVRTEAKKILGQQASSYRDTSADARQGIPRESEITLIPTIPHVEFNPPRRTFRWSEDVHREEFRIRASDAAEGTVVRGVIAAYLGTILLAEVDLAIRVDSTVAPPDPNRPEMGEPSTARPYRRIFASYSHRDLEVVRQFEWYARTMGDRYLRDVCDLRAGEEWDAGLLDLIRQADVFQLFWSTNAMRSAFVRREWEYALSLGRPAFIRPTYWEDPLPVSQDEGLPPETLLKLHFHQVVHLRATSPPDSSSGVAGVSFSPAGKPIVTREVDMTEEEWDARSNPPLPPAKEDEFELSLDADSDDFELQHRADASDEVALSGPPRKPKSNGSGSGINLNRPADSGVSLERKKEEPDVDDDEIDFELSLDSSSVTPDNSVEFAEPDPDSEFELSLDEPSNLALGSASDESETKKGDIFEATDFEIPPLEDDSVSLDDWDGDADSSDSDLALDMDDECKDEVVALDDDDAPARKKSKKKMIIEEDDDSSAGPALRGCSADDDEPRPRRFAPVPRWERLMNIALAIVVLGIGGGVIWFVLSIMRK